MKKRKFFSIFFTILTVFAFFKPQKKILGWGRKIHIFTTSEAQMTHFSWNFFRTKSVLKLVRVSTTLGTWKNPPKNSDTWSALYNHIVRNSGNLPKVNWNMCFEGLYLKAFMLITKCPRVWISQLSSSRVWKLNECFWSWYKLWVKVSFEFPKITAVLASLNW